MSDERPITRRRLAHCAGWQNGTRQYDLHPIMIRRPDEGAAAVTVTCGSCGKKVGLTVDSDRVRRARFARSMRSAIFRLLLMFGPFVAAGIGLAVAGASWQVLVTLFVLGWLFLFPAMIANYAGFVSRLGISRAYTGLEIDSSGHTLRRPGAVHDRPYRQSRDPDLYAGL